MSWTLGVSLILARLLYVEALHSRAAVRGEMIVFHGSLGMRLVLGGGILGLSAFIIQNADDDWRVQLSLVLFVALCCFIWPSTIIVGRDYIEHQVWWRRSRKIPWNQVLTVLRSSYGEMVVIAKHHRCIRFSRYHVDSHRFQDEVMRRANLKTVIDAAAAPSLHL
jgi:hypothetical protein